MSDAGNESEGASKSAFVLPTDVREGGTFAAPPPPPKRSMPIALGICIFIVLLNVMAGFVHGHFWEPVIELGVALGLASGSGWARRFAQGVAVLQMVIWFVLLILSWHLTTEEWAIALTMIGFDTVWLVTLSLPSVEAYFAPVGRTR